MTGNPCLPWLRTAMTSLGVLCQLHVPQDVKKEFLAILMGSSGGALLVNETFAVWAEYHRGFGEGAFQGC